METPESESLPAAPGNDDTRNNVEGRRALPSTEGFGQLWYKRLSMVLLIDHSPEAVMAYWKEELDALWPRPARLYPPRFGVQTGEVAGIDLSVGPAKLSTGVLVVESGETSFALRAPEGHMFAGSIQFSTDSVEGGVEASVTISFRANDPLYEAGLMFGGHRVEERFWADLLWNLAAHYGQRPRIRLVRRCVDRRRHWRKAANIRYNAAIRTNVRRAGRAVRRLVPAH